MPDRSRDLFRHAQRHPRCCARRLAPIDTGRDTRQASGSEARGPSDGGVPVGEVQIEVDLLEYGGVGPRGRHEPADLLEPLPNRG